MKGLLLSILRLWGGEIDEETKVWDKGKLNANRKNGAYQQRVRNVDKRDNSRKA
ncbi:hypothetical protein [Alteromonas sp. V450]|uniref:hypothetical protein n=1 Tax=Alteromonas sp. V450 TaxID=1912139 RepID=UPI0015A6C321|nr:hypothetical protein [Alteromonas sp. V450]